MTIVQFLSREKLVEYLDEELRLFLNATEIYEINQYGWLTDGRPDPEYIGHAMWQTEPPVSHNKIVNFSQPSERPAFSQTVVSRIRTAGLEFEALMKSARHSIGLTYLYHKDTDNLNHCFSYHFSDTAIKLAMATGRLQELFVDAFSTRPEFDLKGLDPADAYSRKEQHQIFCRPFQQTRDKLAEKPAHYEELLACVEELLPLIKQVSIYRIEGHSESNGQAMTRTTDYEGHQDSLLDGETETHRISEWYKLLVKTSNQIFLAEYLLRNFDKKLPIASLALSH